MPLSLTEAATALRDGVMTSVELTTAALSRANAVDERLGVYRSRLDERAMDAAGRADTDFATGRDRGLLQGIPIGLEDIPAIDDGAAAGAADGATVGPSPALDPAWLTEREAPVVARIRRAGAVITGRLSTSGTGMGVAAGLFLASVGPDTDGSIRIPAACCGISGLVPTSRRVPIGGGHDHVAPLARSARDCAAVLGVIAGHHQQLAGGGDGAAAEYLGALCGSLAGVRLGVHRASAEDRTDADHTDADHTDADHTDADHTDADQTDIDPEAAGLVDDAVAVLANLGADLVEVTLPSWPGGDERDRRAAQAALDEMATLFAGVDAVVGATTAAASTGHEEPLDRPVLVLPMGFGSRGQPLSLEVVGRPFEEATVLRVGDAYQQITDWHRQIPDLAGVPAWEA